MTAPRHFDLTQTGTAYDKFGIRTRRFLMAGFLALGVAMALSGLLAPFPRSTAGQARPILIIGGVAVIIGYSIALPSLPRAGRAFEISAEALVVTRLDGREYRLAWSDPKFRLAIYDWRSIPASGRDRGLQEVMFVLAPPFAVETPITLEMTKEIIEQAERHHLKLQDWSETPLPAGELGVVRITQH